MCLLGDFKCSQVDSEDGHHRTDESWCSWLVILPYTLIYLNSCFYWVILLGAEANGFPVWLTFPCLVPSWGTHTGKALENQCLTSENSAPPPLTKASNARESSSDVAWIVWPRDKATGPWQCLSEGWRASCWDHHSVVMVILGTWGPPLHSSATLNYCFPPSNLTELKTWIWAKFTALRIRGSPVPST